MDLIEEKGLVEKARRDPEVFGRLYDQYYSQIFNYILRRVANLEIAQDITSEVFLKALKNLGQFYWRNIPFSSWLYRIATNQITDYFRRGKHKMFSLEEIPDSITPSNPSIESEVLETEEELRRHEDFLLLHENISKLPIKYQEVITLRFFENKQIKEIAEILESGAQIGRVVPLPFFQPSDGNLTMTAAGVDLLAPPLEPEARSQRWMVKVDLVEQKVTALVRVKPFPGVARPLPLPLPPLPTLPEEVPAE